MSDPRNRKPGSAEWLREHIMRDQEKKERETRKEAQEMERLREIAEKELRQLADEFDVPREKKRTAIDISTEIRDLLIQLTKLYKERRGLRFNDKRGYIWAWCSNCGFDAILVADDDGKTVDFSLPIKTLFCESCEREISGE